MKIEKANEKRLEKRFREGVEKLGGTALKFTSPYFTGMPDRIVLLPGGVVWFVELKSTGSKPDPRQRAVHRLLKRLGCRVEVVDDEISLAVLLNKFSYEV